MKTADTSLIVAAFASWHEDHEVARDALDSGIRLIAHCALETYSVLTRLPPPHRVSPAIVRDFLAGRFPDPLLHLSPAAFRVFLLGLPERGLSGGRSYDALVAATAAAHDAELITCDRRALPTYERFGLRAVLLN